MIQRVVGDAHDIAAMPDLDPFAQPDLLADAEAIEALLGTDADGDDNNVLGVEIAKASCRPVVRAEQVGVHQGQPGRPRVHERRMRFVLLVRAERRQSQGTGFDFVARRMAGGVLQVVVLLVRRVRVVDHQRTGLARHHRDVVEDLQQVLPPRDGVVPLDELGRRHRQLPVIEDHAPQLPYRAVDPLGLLLSVDQLRAVRHAGHEACRVQVDHIDAPVVAVVVPVQSADRQALQVQRGGRRRLAGVGA